MSLFKEALAKQQKESKLVKFANVIDFIGEGGRLEIASARNISRDSEKGLALALIDKDGDRVVYSASGIISREILACDTTKEVEAKLTEILLTGVIWETTRTRLNTETDKMETVNRRVVGVEAEGTGLGSTVTKELIKQAKERVKEPRKLVWEDTIAFGN